MKKLDLVFSNRFKKDIKLAQKRGLDLNKFEYVVEMLSTGQKLPPKYVNHDLKGIWKGCRDCHIQGDWILIYKIIEDRLELYCIRMGTHSDLFK